MPDPLHPAALPDEIEAASLAVIDAEVPEPRPFAGDVWRVVRRMIHTTADFEMLELVRFSPDAVESGVAALAAGCLVVTDTEMAKAGIPLRRVTPLGCEVRSYTADPRTADLARELGVTRARAGMDLALEAVERGGGPAVFVIGNAPTALLALLERIGQGAGPPALIVGMPVGFVNAAESKQRLVEAAPCPYVTVTGRKGGSALAACVVNQLAELALERG